MTTNNSDPGELIEAAPILKAILDVPEERRMDTLALAIRAWFDLLKRESDVR